ncbi:MAG: hypothetical protein AB8G11_01190 [Saprospiraceae bacterium]
MKKLFYLLIFISYSTIGFSQNDAMFTIEGTVWNLETDDFLENATIFLIKDEVRVDSMLSDKNGQFSFDIIENGCYHLNCQLNGYESKSTDNCYKFQKNDTISHEFRTYLFEEFTFMGCGSTGEIFQSYPDSLLFETKLIIQNEQEQLLDEILLIYITPNSTEDNLETFYCKDDCAGIQNIVLFQGIEYEVVILKKGYKMVDETVEVQQLFERMIITLKKEN